MRRTWVAIAVLLVPLWSSTSSALGEEVLPQGETFSDTTAQFQAAPPRHLVTDIVLSRPTPNIVKFGDFIDIRFNYETTEPGGVRIFALPLTGAAGTAATPNYGVCGSPVYPAGTGTGSSCITIDSGKITVDWIRFQITNADQSKLLFQVKLPVHYKFR